MADHRRGRHAVLAIRWSELRLCDVVDALLYLGPLASYTWSQPDFHPVDEADRAELRRRADLWGDQEFFVEELAALDE